MIISLIPIIIIIDDPDDGHSSSIINDEDLDEDDARPDNYRRLR